MKQELQEKLFEKYPVIFRQKDLPMQQTCMCWGICTGDGWYNIVDMLCHAIKHHVEWKQKKDEPVQQVEATQVKEKFGGLRFYYKGGDDYISGLVSMAEAMSEVTCAVCGSPATTTFGRWTKVCVSCEKDRVNSLKA